MHLDHTQRGFHLGTFTDANGVACSIQKSSVATEDRIWLGTSVDRMHLTREQVKELIPHLQKFVDTGELQ